MTATESPFVDDCLRRLRAALAGLPTDRRREIIEGISQHIAEARLRLGQDSDEAILWLVMARWGGKGGTLAC